MAKKQKKTNVMRILDTKKIPYQHYEYEGITGMLDGVTVANMIGKDASTVYKTLVTSGKPGTHYVYVLPVNKELDLKKAARAVGEKKVEMIPVKSIEPTTGYVKGGCSPVGMKRAYPTVFDASALELTTVIFNGGKVGTQVELVPDDITKVIRCTFADICTD